MSKALNPSAPSIKLTRSRLIGIVLLCLWALMGAGGIYMLLAGYDAALYAKYLPKLANGTLVTIQLVSLSLLFGALLSLPVTAGRMSKNKATRFLSFAYSYAFRGTPLLAQTFLVYYGAGTFRPFLQDIGLWWFFRDAINCAVFTFALNTAAYQAEILRGAILSISKGQTEAAQALGMKPLPTFLKIILPQALIVALRPYGNEIILVIKASAIASVITVLDLMGETRRAFSRTFDFQLYLWAAIMYLVLVESLRRFWDYLERRLTRHLRKRE